MFFSLACYSEFTFNLLCYGTHAYARFDRVFISATTDFYFTNYCETRSNQMFESYRVISSHFIRLSFRKLIFFFGPMSPKVSSSLTNCTLCVIKPHAVAEGLTGKIMSAIHKAGFNISALQMFRLEKANAEEFYEIYKGVVNEYSVSVLLFVEVPKSCFCLFHMYQWAHLFNIKPISYNERTGWV